jgi:hypothetical protein
MTSVMTEELEKATIARCEASRSGFGKQFNAGNSEMCGSYYAVDAVMNPMGSGAGIQRGREACTGFWKHVIETMGAKDFIEWDKGYTVLDGSNVLYTARWKMSILSGTIHNEHWRATEGDAWELVSDVFEVERKFTAE